MQGSVPRVYRVNDRLALGVSLIEKLIGFATLPFPLRDGRLRNSALTLNRDGWRWPLDAIHAVLEPGVMGIVNVPEFEGLLLQIRLTEDLFQPRTSLRERLRCCFPDGAPPFNFVALALATKREQSLTPRPSQRLIKSITRVEISWANALFIVAKGVAEDLVHQIEAQGTAKLCAHCRARFHEAARSYCSPTCRKSADNRKSYQGRLSRLGG